MAVIGHVLRTLAMFRTEIIGIQYSNSEISPRTIPLRCSAAFRSDQAGDRVRISLRIQRNGTASTRTGCTGDKIWRRWNGELEEKATSQMWRRTSNFSFSSRDMKSQKSVFNIYRNYILLSYISESIIWLGQIFVVVFFCLCISLPTLLVVLVSLLFFSISEENSEAFD